MPSSVLSVVSEPHRREILDLLRAEERSVHELVARTRLSQPLVSKHLRVLREAGLVSASPRAQERVYRLEAEPLREIDEWLAPYRDLWNHRLDRLEQHLTERRSDGRRRAPR